MEQYNCKVHLQVTNRHNLLNNKDKLQNEHTSFGRAPEGQSLANDSE